MAAEESDNLLVLFADDDEAQRFLLKEALENAGFSVFSAPDGQIAIEEAHRLHPDLLLLDVSMPNIDGFAACTEIRKSPTLANLPIVMVTGADDVQSIEQAYKVGATDFIPKPINYTILCQRLRYIHRATQNFEKLRLSEARLANAQRIACLGSWELDLKSKNYHCSEGALRVFGINDPSAFTKHEAFLARIIPEDRVQLETFISNAFAARRGFDLDCRIDLGDSNRRIIAINAIFGPDEAADASILRGTYQDITERRYTEARMHHLAYHDTLTNLPNRRLFKDRLSQAVARSERDGTMVGVLCLDLDHFKDINDTLGHSMGDQLLRNVVQRLIGVVRGTDTVARLGGDEFAILQTGFDQPTGAKSLAERLIKAMAQPFKIDGHEIVIGTSIGISAFPPDSSDPDQLMVNADIALFRSKSKGRGIFSCFEPGMEQLLKERKAMERDLRTALEKGWFELHYQPQVITSSNSIVGVEALIRLRHPERGLVMPNEFIHIAEATGLIVPIGEWVLLEACNQAVQWQTDFGPALRVAVNLSMVQFSKSDLFETVKKVLHKSGLDPVLLELEITESILMNETSNTVDVLKKLKSLGVQIAMDDFGTGYSSLSYLRLFPFDRIKIDRSFINELNEDPDAAAIVRGIVSLGKSLNMSTTAEGVETLEQLAYLKDQSCDEVQGFYFGRPVPANQLVEQIKRLSEKVDSFTAA